MSKFGHCALICCLAFGAVAVTYMHIFNKSAFILLIIGSRSLQRTFRKPQAANLLVLSDLIFFHPFKVKPGQVNIKEPISYLLLVTY